MSTRSWLGRAHLHRHQGWWDGVILRGRERNWFPSNYVRRLSDEEAERLFTSRELELELDAAVAEPGPGLLEAADRLTDSGSNDSLAGQEGWADWIPRVSDDGRIFYVNTQSGKLALELPSAEAETSQPHAFALGLGSGRGATLAPSSAPSSVSEDDSDAFFDEHGFSRLGRDTAEPGFQGARSATSPASATVEAPAMAAGGFASGSVSRGSPPRSPSTSHGSVAAWVDLSQPADFLAEAASPSSAAPPPPAHGAVGYFGSEPVVPSRASRGDVLGALNALRECLEVAPPTTSARHALVPVVRARTRSLVDEVREFLQSVGQGERKDHLGPPLPSTETHVDPTKKVTGDLQACTKRVTTELSKLVASTRALWSILAAEDEPGRLKISLHPSVSVDLLEHEQKLRHNCLGSLEVLWPRLEEVFRLTDERANDDKHSGTDASLQQTRASMLTRWHRLFDPNGPAPVSLRNDASWASTTEPEWGFRALLKSVEAAAQGALQSSARLHDSVGQPDEASSFAVSAPPGSARSLVSAQSSTLPSDDWDPKELVQAHSDFAREASALARAVEALLRFAGRSSSTEGVDTPASGHSGETAIPADSQARLLSAQLTAYQSASAVGLAMQDTLVGSGHVATHKSPSPSSPLMLGQASSSKPSFALDTFRLAVEDILREVLAAAGTLDGSLSSLQKPRDPRLSRVSDGSKRSSTSPSLADSWSEASAERPASFSHTAPALFDAGARASNAGFGRSPCQCPLLLACVTRTELSIVGYRYFRLAFASEQGGPVLR